jgi:hypothetical protein
MKGGEKRMKKTILATLLALALVLIPAGSALAAPSTTGTVSITMTGGSLAITVYDKGTSNPATWNPTERILNDTKYTTTSADQEFTLTNAGTVTVDTTIIGADMSGPPAWTLSDTGDNTGSTYGLWYKKFGGADTVIQRTTALTFVAPLAEAGLQDFGLSMLTPADGAAVVNGTVYTTQVTITAVQTP